VHGVPSNVICISHTTGAEGEQLGAIVAERLGFRYLDDEIVDQAAEWASLDPAVVADVERRKGVLARFFNRLGDSSGSDSPRISPTSPGWPVTGDDARRVPSDETLRGLIRDVIRDAAEEGEAVITAHAASMVLGKRPGVLRVLVTASPAIRAERVAKERDLDERRASDVIQNEDTARASYFRRFFRIEQELPTHYDLVVNTDLLRTAEAADIVVFAAGGAAR
jgi:hypothetical protein